MVVLISIAMGGGQRLSSKKKNTDTGDTTTPNSKLRVTIYARYSSDGQRERNPLKGNYANAKNLPNGRTWLSSAPM